MRSIVWGLLQRSESHASGEIRCLQLRGEYLYAAEGVRGMRVYDVASIANKGVSQKIISAPAGPLGQNTAIASANATCVALPTNQPIDPPRDVGERMRVQNQELPFHPLYNYAYIVDAVEGLILTDVRTLADREPRNNFLKRALTWNPEGVLTGARHLSISRQPHCLTPRDVVVVSIDQPFAAETAGAYPDGRPAIHRAAVSLFVRHHCARARSRGCHAAGAASRRGQSGRDARCTARYRLAPAYVRPAARFGVGRRSPNRSGSTSATRPMAGCATSVTWWSARPTPAVCVPGDGAGGLKVQQLVAGDAAQFLWLQPGTEATADCPLRHAQARAQPVPRPGA